MALLTQSGRTVAIAAAALSATAASALSVQTGVLNGHKWMAESTIVGQTSTATQAPPIPPGTVGNPIYLANTPKYSGVVQLTMHEAGGDFLCSGSLLGDRITIVTAGHCVSNGGGEKHITALSATAYFNTHAVDTVNYVDPASVAISVASIHVNPKYTGEVIDDNDVAILRLSRPAPKSATSYAMYDTTDLTGLDYNVAGFGRRSDQGGSVGADLGAGRIRQGDNRYDFAFGDPAFFDDFTDPNSGDAFGKAEVTYSYAADFDNGLASQDSSCILAGFFGAGGSQFCNLGRGATEVSTAPGDSGGPQFVDGKIASVTSYGLSFGAGIGDIDNNLNDSFGEFNGFAPLFHSAAFIAGVPEPTSWGLMVAGFGLVGAVARRRRGAVAA